MVKDFVAETLNTVDGIAIVGMDGRFPGADSIDQFWQNIRDGIESITVFTDEALAAAGVPMATRRHPNYVKAGAVVSGVDQFDAPFFGISPREAKSMDPQHRILLECAWGALENAGYTSETYDGRIGVYTGTSLSTYLHHNLLPNPEFLNLAGDLQIELGNDKDFVPTRISYKMNLTGPSVCINTACSTSLVAVHMACQGLLDQECDMALAGGATIQVPQPQGYWYQPEGIASPDGHCRPFDAQAQGTIFGSGVGVVVLKRLEDALAARDHIYAVIRGSAINNDGSLKVGYTAPSVDGQADAIAEAQAIAGVEPETISYIEAHGTATGMGDPIEVAALTQVFRAETDQTGFCALGSVKGNIGHLNRAAGVIGLIKTTLALQHQQLPPSLHFEQPNPQIDFDQSPFYVNTHLQPWQTPGFPRRAGVSSFGIGGTNAHAVLEEAPATPSAEPPPRPHPRRLRAGQTGTARGAAPQNLARHLRQHPDVGLADVAFTLQTGRQAFQHRRILVCETCDQAIASLSAPPPSRSLTQASSPSVVFMFSGQGAQYVNMAHDLYQHEPVFRAHVDRCAQLLQPDLKVDLCQLLYPSPDQAESATQQLKQTALTQPALFVVEYALAQLWITWGVQPQAMIGHSIGEYVAACLSGVFSLEDALVLVTKRGQMMQSLPQGSMLAVFLPPDQISSLLTPDLSLATHNSPTVSAVSGPDAAIDALETQLQAQAIDCRRIHTSHAFHSQMMEPILGDFAALVGKSSLNPPQIPFVSNVTGTWITAAEATDPSYWAQHIRQTVRFADGVNLLCQDPDQILLEVGPGKSLCSLVKQNPFAFGKTILSSARHPKEDISDVAFVLQTLGQLWLAGLSVDWAKLYAPQSRQRLPLPTYPFERQRYWVDPQPQPTIQPLSHAANLSTQLTQLLEQSDQFSDQERTLLHKLLSRLDPSSQPVVDPEEMSAGNPDWFYQLAWQPTPHTVKGNASVNASVNASGRWLILADRGGLGQALGTQLAHAGQECILAFAADVDQPQAPSKESPIWHLNPSEPRQFEQLLQAVFSPGELPLLGIIHLWSLDTPPTAELTADALAQSQLLSVGSALHLVQALGQLEEKAESNAGKPAPRLWLVTQNAMPVSDAQPTIAVAQSSLWGLGKVIALEHPSLWGGLIDLGDDIPDVAAVVARALLAADDEDQLAFRADQRYVARLVRAANPPQSASVPLHRDGTYLITGGLGALGLQVAKWLVKQGARHLVLIGRRPPSGSAWVVIEYLEQLGVEIHIAQADVAGFDELAQVFKGFETSMPPLRGLVHTAGVLDDGALWQQNWDRFVGVMRPKVQGAWNLHCLTHKTPLDFFLNFSSVIALLGNPGQSNYAAANVFLDALAHFRQSLGQPTLSVNWGLWEQGGMASASLEAKLGRMGIKPLPSAPALAALTTLLADTLTNPDRAQAAVASIDWSVFKELHGASGQQPLLVELKGTSPLPAAPPVSQQNLLQTLQTIPASEYTQHLVVYCQNLVAKTLSIRPDQLDRDQALNYLGLDSLMAIQLRNLIKNQLQVNIPTAKFMAGLSVDSLASLIAEALPTTLQPVAPFTDESSDLLPKTLEPDPVNQSQATQPTTAKQMLDNLDQLADEDVDALLQTLLTE